MIRLCCMLTFLGAFSISPALAANVECQRMGIRFTGKIEVGDYARVVQCKNVLFEYDFTDYPVQNTTTPRPPERPTLLFAISSEGGSVLEAMRIGRYIRSQKMFTVVADTGKCFSSCIYILAAGVVRHAWGDVGIHRPYFEARPTQGYDAALKLLLDNSRLYFREMNISEFLADDMFSILPQDLRILGEASLSRYRLNQNDMAYDEENNINNANLFGLTRKEYMRRLALSEKYAKECRATKPKPMTTDQILQCGDIAYQQAGLIPKD
jgi:hypothetical protein